MKLLSWNTNLSNSDGFVLEKVLEENGELIITYKSDSERYDIKVQSHSVYIISEESRGDVYWSAKAKDNIGDTFIVKDSLLLKYYGMDYMNDFEHYVISTEDAFVEIFSMFQPRIYKVNNE